MLFYSTTAFIARITSEIIFFFFVYHAIILLSVRRRRERSQFDDFFFCIYFTLVNGINYAAAAAFKWRLHTTTLRYLPVSVSLSIYYVGTDKPYKPAGRFAAHPPAPSFGRLVGFPIHFKLPSVIFFFNRHFNLPDLSAVQIIITITVKAARVTLPFRSVYVEYQWRPTRSRDSRGPSSKIKTIPRTEVSK